MIEGMWALTMPVTHTAIAEWIACVVYVSCMPKRLKIWQLICVLTVALPLLIVTHQIRNNAVGLVWILGMTLGLAEMYLLIWLCNRVSMVQATYLWARAFVVAEFVASLEWEAIYYSVISFKINVHDSWYMTPLIMSVCYLCSFGVILLLEKKTKLCTRLEGLKRKEAFSAILIAVAAFSLSNISFGFRDSMYAESLGVGMLTVRTLADLSGIIMLMAQNEIRREIVLQYELEGMNGLLQRQYEQYQRYRDNDEMIRRQYHDLKHQIAVIRAERDPVKQDSYLAKMDEAIETYQTQHKTGHPVIDTVLSGKNLECRDKGVSLLSYADAAALDFVSAMDLCSIFGNALDNAIECAARLNDADKRVVKVYVYTQNQFVLIRFENFYDQTLQFVDGLPRTTKENELLHGFGLRNIRENAAKYGGTISVHTENSCFQLVVLLPIRN